MKRLAPQVVLEGGVKESMISVVCVYNNEKSLKDYLLRSLNRQSCEYEPILLDNSQGQFQSAAEALNWGGGKAKGKYIMFAHQDVMLGSHSWLKEVEKVLDKLPNLGIAGVAGKSENKKGVITNIKHGTPAKLAGEIQVENPTKVQTLDECLVMIPKSVFSVLQFDEKTCDDWHLYAVDYCLSCKRLGFDVYVIPMFLYHRSEGVFTKSRVQILKSLRLLPKSYYLTLEMVLNKHRNQYKRVYTTCGDWSTSHPIILQRIRTLANAGLKLLFRKLRGDRQKGTFLSLR